MDNIPDLQVRLEALKRLNRGRFDYVLARASSPSISAALDEIGLSSGWYYRFSEEERTELEALALEVHYSEAIQARLILAQAAPEAARVKVGGLKSKDKRLQQDAATEVLDRTVGKAQQPIDITSNGQPIQVVGIGVDTDKL